MNSGLAVATFICLGIGCAWIIFGSYSKILNAIAVAVGIVFPTIVLGVNYPMPDIVWWGMLLALLGFLVFTIGIIGLGHGDLFETKIEDGKAYAAFTGIGAVACMLDILFLWIIVSFFVNLGK